MKPKNYKSYADYIRHQQSKQINRENSSDYLNNPDVKAYEQTLCQALIRRLYFNPFMPNPRNKAICLGARAGGEIKAFEFLNIKTIGIDLYPAGEKIIKADFHYIPFMDKCFDIVYTNSLDHSLYPDKLFEETKRILTDTGIFLLEIADANSGKASFGAWECLSWDDDNEVFDLLKQHNFKIQHVTPFEFPWWGLSITATKA